MTFSRKFLLFGAAGLALAVAGCSNKTDVSSDQAKAKAKQEAKLKSVSAMIRMGDQTREGGDPVAALRFYARAARLSPNNAAIQTRLGYSLLSMQRYRAAGVAFRQALAAKPGNPAALRGLGNALIALDRADLAVTYLKQAIANAKKGKADHRAFNSLGVALDMTGDHKGARQAYRLGLEQKPESLALRNNLGLSLALSGEYRQSMAVLEGVARDGGTNPRVKQNLALVYGLAGRNKMAARAIGNQFGEAAVKTNVKYYRWLRRSRRNVTGKTDRREQRGLAARETARRSKK